MGGLTDWAKSPITDVSVASKDFRQDMGKGQKDVQKSETELPEWMVPYAKDYLGKASDISNKPYTPYDGQTVASMDPTAQAGLDMTKQMAQQGSPLYGAAGSQLQSTINGGGFRPAATNANAGATNPYAGSNPYLQSQIDAAQGDTVRNYNTAVKPATESAMVGSGSFGNSGLMQMQQGQQSDLQKNLGGIASQMRFNDYGLQAQLSENATNRSFSAGEAQANRDQGAYSTERSNQLQAASGAPAFAAARYNDANMLTQAGQAQQTQKQTELSDAYQKWMDAQGFDTKQLGVLGGAIGTLKPGVGVTTQSNNEGSGNGLQNAAAMAMIARSLWTMSDRRLKTDIKRVGKTDDGMGIYTYRYKSGGGFQMGLMAQEVEKKHPDAVARRDDGMRAVNYGLLGGK